MNNRLPEKLTAVRKHFGYAQADVASKLNVSVAEYMSWENGAMICRIEQLRKLSQLYSIPLVDFLDNTRELRMPREDQIYHSVQIPFQNLNRPASEETLEEDIADNILPIPSVQPEPVPVPAPQTVYPASDGGTLDISRPDVTGTIEFGTEAIEEPVSERTEEYGPDGFDEEPSPIKKRILIGIAALCAILMLFGLSRMFRGNDEEDDSSITVRISDVNRLALGRTFSAFIDDDGRIKSMGNLDISQYTDLVQISAANSWLAGLKNDGTVMLAGSSSYTEAKTWQNITMIAAADTHIAGLQDDGTVICTGSDEACKVEEWKDIKYVYAGNGYTVGQKKNGSLVVSGNISCASVLESLTNVRSLSASDSYVTVIDDKGGVTCYAAGSASSLNTTSWSGMTSAAAGSGFAAGLTSDGKVTTASTDDAFSKQAAALKNVRYIAARGGTLVAVNYNGDIIGAGDNTNKVYGTASETPEPSEETVKLDKVTNVSFETGKENVTIKWNSVTGAKYYMIKVNTMPETSLRSAKNSTSIPTKNLKNGTVYKVTLTAYGSSEEESSEPTVLEFKYTAAPVKLAAPTNLTASATEDSWNLSWDAVTDAAEYIISVNTDPATKMTSTKNSCSIPASSLKNGSTYKISVIASDGKDDANNSDPLTSKLKYSAAAVQLDTPANITAESGENHWIITWDKVEHADSYKVTVGSDTQSLLVTTNRAEYIGSLKDGEEYEVRVTALPKSGSDAYEASEPGVARLTYGAYQYKVTVKFTGAQTNTVELYLKKGTYAYSDVLTEYLTDGNMLSDPSRTFNVNSNTEVSDVHTVSQEDICNADGNIWQDGACKTPEQACSDEGNVWKDGACITPERDCLENGGTWSDGACKTEQQICDEQEGFHWSDGACVAD